MKAELKKRYKRIKYTKLIVSIAVDFIGNATYLIPGIGEGVDVIWAFLSGGILMFALYPKHKIGAALGGVEELLPGTDIVPTALLLWIADYIVNDKKTFANYVRGEVDQEQVIEEILETRRIGNKN